MMTGSWLRLETRSRWRALAALALLVAVALTAALAAAAGARRGAERGRPDAGGHPAGRRRWCCPTSRASTGTTIRALPSVEALATFPATGHVVLRGPAGHDGQQAAARRRRRSGRPSRSRWSWRAGCPMAADEAAVTSAIRRDLGQGRRRHRHHAAVHARGGRPRHRRPDAPWQSLTVATGPRLAVRITAIIRSGWFSDSLEAPAGDAHPSPRLLPGPRAQRRRWPGTWPTSTRMVRLQAPLPQFTEEAGGGDRAHRHRRLGHEPASSTTSRS